MQNFNIQGEKMVIFKSCIIEHNFIKSTSSGFNSTILSFGDSVREGVFRKGFSIEKEFEWENVRDTVCATSAFFRY